MLDLKDSIKIPSEFLYSLHVDVRIFGLNVLLALAPHIFLLMWKLEYLTFEIKYVALICDHIISVEQHWSRYSLSVYLFYKLML